MPKKMNTKDLVTKIEKLTKERIAKEKVVSLDEYRQIKGRFQQQSILVIEDDETMRKAMQRIFQDEGHKVVAAADGTQLSTVLDENPIDLIIMDVGLPWVNGFELAKLMKEDRDLKSIPIVFVSGRTSEEDVKTGFAVGADDYIKKPFDIEELKNSVYTLLKINTNK